MIYALMRDHVTAMLVREHDVLVAPCIPAGTLLEEIEVGSTSIIYWTRFRVISGEHAGCTFTERRYVPDSILRRVSPLEALAKQVADDREQV